MSEGASILVTGGAGFIGSHVVDRLLHLNHPVVVADNLSTGRLENLSQWQSDQRLKFLELDVSRPISEDTIEKIGDIDRIIHLSAQVSVPQSIKDPFSDLRHNLEATLNLLEFGKKRRIKKFVFASSAAVYGDVEATPVSESLPCAPRSPYGIHKLASEKHLYYYHQIHHLPTTALRFFNVYGPRQRADSPYSGVIAIFSDRATNNVPISIHGEGRQTRDFVFVKDVAKVICDIAFSALGDGKVFNLGRGVPTTISQLAQKIIDASKSSSPIEYQDSRIGDVQHSTADVTQLQECFGISCDTELVTGLTELIASQKGSEETE